MSEYKLKDKIYEKLVDFHNEKIQGNELSSTNIHALIKMKIYDGVLFEGKNFLEAYMDDSVRGLSTYINLSNIANELKNK